MMSIIIKEKNPKFEFWETEERRMESLNFSSALAKEEEKEEVDVSVPSGFRFLPTDLELIRNYLCKKITNQKLPSDLPVVEFDIYSTQPWNLPENNKIDTINSKKSYYFVKLLDEIGRVRKRIVNPSSAIDDNGGGRRRSGYWEKIAKSSRYIRDEKNKSIGVKKSFVFYAYLNPETSSSSTGAAMKTWKTNWILDEYSLNSQRNLPWVLCIVRKKVGDEDEDDVKLLESIEQLPEKIVEQPNLDYEEEEDEDEDEDEDEFEEEEEEDEEDEYEDELLAWREQVRKKIVYSEVEIMEKIKTIQEFIKENQIQIWKDQFELFKLIESRVWFRFEKKMNIYVGRSQQKDRDESKEFAEEKELEALATEVAVIRAGSYYQVDQKLNRFKITRKRNKKRIAPIFHGSGR